MTCLVCGKDGLCTFYGKRCVYAQQRGSSLYKRDIQAFIRNELRDLEVPKNSRAYTLAFENALEASDIMLSVELKKYIAEYLDSLPNSMFN